VHRVKDQFFGDVNDYAKYGILRSLSSGSGLETSVCWAMTPDESGAGGARTAYLRDPDRWSSFDPELFRGLRQAVVTDCTRSVRAIEKSGLLARCRFWSEELPDDPHQRAAFVSRFLDFSFGADLAFFDPDNGLEVSSAPPGSPQSSRYVYWAEMQEVWKRGHSILIYQHFPRVARTPYVEARVAQIGDALGAQHVVTFQTTQVVFLLAVNPAHWERIREGVAICTRRWSGAVSIVIHRMVGSEPHSSARVCEA
jgi:hypothetical protein